MIELGFEFERTQSGPWALVGAGPDRLASLLREFESLVDGASSPARLNPGLAEGEVQQQFAAAGLTCPEELVVWFGWHNGYPANDRGASFTTPSIRTESLEFLLSRGMVNNTSWMSMGNGPGQIVVDTGTPRGELLRVAHLEEDLPFYPGIKEDDLDGRTASLSTLVAWWIIGVKQGGYLWDGNGWDGRIPLMAKTQQESVVW
jgi:hypothetical protein